MNTLVSFPRIIPKRQLRSTCSTRPSIFRDPKRVRYTYARTCAKCAIAAVAAGQSDRGALGIGDSWRPSRCATSASGFPSRSGSSSSAVRPALIVAMATAPRADTPQPIEAASCRWSRRRSSRAAGSCTGPRSGQSQHAAPTPTTIHELYADLVSWRTRAGLFAPACKAFVSGFDWVRSLPALASSKDQEDGVALRPLPAEGASPISGCKAGRLRDD